MSAAPATPAATTAAAIAAAALAAASTGPLAISRINNSSLTTFSLPSGIALPKLNGANWTHWSQTFEVLLTIQEAEDIINLDTNPDPAIITAEVWESLMRRGNAYLCLYMDQDIHSLVASNIQFLMFKSKWDALKVLYSGQEGSTSVFNMWIALVQTKFDNASPLAPQLAKLNELRVALANSNMGVTEAQYSLILLNALPSSYETVATILLASGPATSLKPSNISARVINEEGWQSGPSASLNVVARAPIKSSDKGKGKKRDHSALTCHYCGKKGHIQPNCRKKKKDDAEKAKKDGASGSGKKAANSHVLVPTTTSIREVDEDNSVSVALYATEHMRWMMDSGATHHITPHRLDFETYTPCNGTVRLGDKSTIDQVGVGSVVFKMSLGTPITLSNVLHLPEVKTRFMSTRALAQKGADVMFTKDSFKIVVNQQRVADGYLENNLYWLDAARIGLNAHVKSATSLHTWHQCMGHISHAALKSYGPSALTGMDLDSSTTAPTVCCGCEEGKSSRKPFSVSPSKRTTAILEIVHSDLAGPMQTISIQGSFYAATFIDDHSKHAVVYFIQLKDQFTVALNTFLSWAEMQTTLKVKVLHSDRGGEYMANQVQDILKQRGIEHHLMMPGSPQSNGKAERFNRTITVPDVSHLHIFGCKGYRHVPADKHRKLDAKAIEVTLVGFEPGSKGYQLWDKQTHSIKLSIDVTFDESSFPSQKDVETRPAPTQTLPVVTVPNLAVQPLLPITRAPSPTPTSQKRRWDAQ
jgi:hypothetical protein